MQEPMAITPTLPTNSAEFINALSHYYRGELSRMMSWRDRLDRTTNWAIGAAAAMLSVSLSTPTAHHGVLLFAMLLVSLLLVIEARRYRFFHVYRSRVRLLERNYYSPLLGGPRTHRFSEVDGIIKRGFARPAFHIKHHTSDRQKIAANLLVDLYHYASCLVY